MQVMVAYMRRFAPAFVQAVEEVSALGKINYARIRDIIGRNRLIIEQSSVVHRFDDVPEALRHDRARAGGADGGGGDRGRAAGHSSAPTASCSVSTATISRRCASCSASRNGWWPPATGMAAASSRPSFQYDGYCAVLETGVDEQRRFDAHLEVYGVTKSIRVQYDSPYIRHLPTTLVIHETIGDAYEERVTRPTFKDPYTHEIEYFHDVVTKGMTPKTTPEDFIEDLRLMRMIVDALRAS